MDIFKPVNKRKKFDRASAGVDEATKRKLEEAILRPDVVPLYSGPLPRYKCNVDRRVVRIVFPTESDMALVGEYFKIAESFRGVKYITHLDLLVEFCKRLRDDRELHDRFSALITHGKQAATTEECNMLDEVEGEELEGAEDGE